MEHLPRVPGYELIQPLGGGPLTTVYSARDAERDIPCAVKMIRDDWDDQPTALKLLQREARAGLAVRHPHLVRLLHAHVTKPPYFLVMELLPGVSLRRRLRHEHRLDIVEGLWIVRQTAEGLAALHRAGFIHGDIKPENVHLARDGHAMLIDLGFAHRAGENAYFLRKGYILGTANYLAPELCRFEEDSGPQSDLYSLGVMLFELVTGRLPFARGAVRETLARHLHEEPLSIRRYAPQAPAALVRLVERLLSREPKDRPRASYVIQQLGALEVAASRRRRSA